MAQCTFQYKYIHCIFKKYSLNYSYAFDRRIISSDWNYKCYIQGKEVVFAAKENNKYPIFIAPVVTGNQRAEHSPDQVRIYPVWSAGSYPQGKDMQGLVVCQADETDTPEPTFIQPGRGKGLGTPPQKPSIPSQPFYGLAEASRN